MKGHSILVFVLIMAVCATIANAQSSRRRVGDTRDPKMQGTVYVSGSPWPHPSTLSGLCRAADLIIDGTVASSLPVRRSIAEVPYTLETDVVISVNRILNGPPSLSNIMVAESGGVQGGMRVINRNNTLMVPRERYILFLLKEDRSSLPMTPGIPRYAVIAGAEGKFLVENDTVQILTKAPSPVQSRYRGAALATFETAIAAAVGR